MNLFQEVLVWKSVDDKTAVRYFCFFDLKSKKYCVQSADFFYVPLDEKQINQSQIQAAELFCGISPLERCDWFDTLVEAISDHDESFDN